ncbi:hypothetical protein Fmac_015948 [Flemingia macrophylla]|uniref:Short-chain dehydrogenase TIC 32, chloroplastic n=1 Tax=Flemingia macrophylla TaxID=520843 RepID=A0ABD1MG10_9FABA
MWPFHRKGASGFSSYSTAEEVTNGIDGSGLTAIVTGYFLIQGIRGIGAETTRVLAMRGVHVIMGVRNVIAGKHVKEAILKEIPTAEVDVMEIDLSSMASVRKFASEFISSGLPLNILINNAGIFATPFTLTEDNIELQFATNYLALILGRYHSWLAYGQSKLANILHANELAKRLKEEEVDITANSLHPGAIVTKIFRHTLVSGLVNTVGRLVFKNVPQLEVFDLDFSGKGFKMWQRKVTQEVPWKGATFRFPEVTAEWLSSSWVGRLRNPGWFNNLNELKLMHLGESVMLRNVRQKLEREKGGLLDGYHGDDAPSSKVNVASMGISKDVSKDVGNYVETSLHGSTQVEVDCASELAMNDGAHHSWTRRGDLGSKEHVDYLLHDRRHLKDEEIERVLETENSISQTENRGPNVIVTCEHVKDARKHATYGIFWPYCDSPLEQNNKSTKGAQQNACGTLIVTGAVNGGEND